MSGEAKDLAPMLGSATDRGRWWIADNQLCHKWFRWFDAEVHCLVIRQDGTRFFWQRDDGETGTATLVAQGDRGAEPGLPVSTIAAVAEQPGKDPAQAPSAPREPHEIHHRQCSPRTVEPRHA